MDRTQNRIRTICEIGMFAAIGFVLDELQGILGKGIFINGGSIGFAMIAVLIIGFRRGWLPALLTGLIMGLFDVATSAYILHPVQLFLDYILPYALVAIGCILQPLFNKTSDKKDRILLLILATVIGGISKFLSHYLAGVIFWADPANFAWDLNSMNPFLYCFIYNIAFIGPSIILTAALLVVMYISAPKIFTVNGTLLETDSHTISSEKKQVLPYVFSGVLTVGGLAVFSIYLIKYIMSFEAYEDGAAIGYDFDPDATILFILGGFLAILGIFSIIRAIKNNYSYLLTSTLGLVIVSTSLIFGTYRLIRCYVKDKDPSTYWLWFGIGIFTVLVFAAFVIISAIKTKKKSN